MQTTRLSAHVKFPARQSLYFKKYSISEKIWASDCFNIEPNVIIYLHYLYLATDNIHIVLENDNTVLIKGLKKVVNVKFSRNTHLIETSYDRLKSRKSHFSNTGKILLKQEFSDGLQISMNIKDITIPLIIHYYLLRAFRTLHKSFHAKSQRFLRYRARRWHNAIRVRAKPCVHRFVVGCYLQKFPVRAIWT